MRLQETRSKAQERSIAVNFSKSWFPRAYLNGPRAIGYRAEDFFEIQRALRFLLA